MNAAGTNAAPLPRDRTWFEWLIIAVATLEMAFGTLLVPIGIVAALLFAITGDGHIGMPLIIVSAITAIVGAMLCGAGWALKHPSRWRWSGQILLLNLLCCARWILR